jgi:RNA polymerase subunit RPABC4/transcription elongation factor Spt4
MECVNCKAIIEDGEKFCSNCGAAITSEMACKNCGTVNSFGSKFCENCGKLLFVSEEESLSENEKSNVNIREKYELIAQQQKQKNSFLQENKGTIELIIKNNLAFKDSDFLFYDAIPPKKRASVLQNYVSLKDDETIICLYDSTVFGGAKEGICLTNYGIYWKELAGERHFVMYSEINNIQIKDKKLFVNTLVIDFYFSSKNSLEKLKKALEEIVALLEKS